MLKISLVQGVVALVLFCIATTCNGQSLHLEGVVKDSLLGTPLSMANVYLKNSTGKILVFDYTNDQGSFTIKTNQIQDTLYLVANSLGYAEQIQTILPDEQSRPFVIALSHQEMALQEVIIRENAPNVFERNDTTSYKVEAFIDSTEFSVEDVIKKIPGIEVSESGGISVNGKPIRKLLIEGDDILGQNYTLGTRNLRANILDQVQIIDRFSDNPVLKEIQASDDIALNLKIKEDKKNIWSGSLTSGLGTGGGLRSFFHGNLFRISKTNKSVILGNYNNTGFDPAGEVFIEPDNVLLDEQVFLKRSYHFINIPQAPSINLPQHLTIENKTGLANFLHSVQVNSNLSIKISALYQHEQTEQDYFNQTNWELDSIDISYRENQTLNQQTENQKYTLTTDWLSKKQNASLKALFFFNSHPNSFSFDLNRIQADSSSVMPIQASEEPKSWGVGLENVISLHEDAVLHSVVTHHSRQSNDLLQVDKNWSYVDSLYFMRQDLGWEESTQNAFVEYIFNKKFLLKVTSGFLAQHYTLDALSGSRSFITDTSLQVLSAPMTTIQRLRWYNKMRWKKSFKVFHVLVGLDHVLERFDGLDLNTFHFVAPRLRLSYRPNRQILFRNQLKWHYGPPANDLFLTTEVFRDYQTTFQGIDQSTLLKHFQVTSFFKYRSKDHLRVFQTSYNFNYHPNALLSNFRLSQTSLEENLSGQVEARTSKISLLFENLFYKIKVNAKVNYQFESYESGNVLNERWQGFQQNTHRIYLEVGTAFRKVINFNLKNQSDFIKNNIETPPSSFQSTTFFNTLHLSMRLEFNKVWRSKLSWYQHFSYSTPSLRNSYHALQLDFERKFKVREKQYHLFLTINNLLNNSAFTSNLTSNNITRQFGVGAVPLYFIVKLDMPL